MWKYRLEQYDYTLWDFTWADKPCFLAALELLCPKLLNLSEKSALGKLYPGSRHAPNLWFCDPATEFYLHRFQQPPTHLMFYLDWDQQLQLQFLVLFRCSCWTFSQGSSFLSLHIDGWPGTRLMGKYLWSFLFYGTVSPFFQVSTTPCQLNQAADWCLQRWVHFSSGPLLLFGCCNTPSVLFSCFYWAYSGKKLRITGKEMGESLNFTGTSKRLLLC